MENLPNFNLLVVWPKSLAFVLFRIFKVLFAPVARETEFARDFDLHLLPEQDQLDVASVCVIVLDRQISLLWLTHQFGDISSSGRPSIFSLVLPRLSPVRTQHKSLHEHSLLIIYSSRRIFWSVNLIEFLKAFQFSAVGCHRLVLADVGSFCSRLFCFFLVYDSPWTDFLSLDSLKV